MNSDNRILWSCQESQCLSFNSQSHRENEFVQAIPMNRESYQENFQMTHETLDKPQNLRPRSASQVQNNISVSTAQFDQQQPREKSLSSLSQELVYSGDLLPENGSLNDSLVSNHYFRLDSSGTLNFSESQLLEMQHLTENIAHTIPQTHEWRTSYQDRPPLDIQPKPLTPSFPGRILQERCVSRDNFHFIPSDIASGNQEINNIENPFLQVEPQEGYFYPDCANRNNSAFSDRHLGNDELHFNQQCLQKNVIAYSSQQYLGNQMISHELHETINVQAGVPATSEPESSTQTQFGYNHRDNPPSRNYADGNLFLEEARGEYSHLSNTSINNITFSNQHSVNDHMPFNQHWLPETEPIQSTQLYQNNRMIPQEIPEVFEVQTGLPRISDPRHSINIKTASNTQCDQQSRTYGENLPLTFCAMTNPIQFSSEQYENLSHSNAPRNLGNNENVSATQTNDANIFQGYNYSTNSSPGNSNFTRNHVLIKNYRAEIHTKERPHQCSVCSKRFTQTAGLSVHMRTHSDNKQYECDTCHKRFKRKDNLVEHIRTHTKERPYQCSVCSRSFAERSVLNVHKRIHSDER